MEDGGELGSPPLPGRAAGIRKSELLTEEGVVVSSSIMKRLQRALLSLGFISSTSSSLYATVVAPPAQDAGKF